MQTYRNHYVPAPTPYGTMQVTCVVDWHGITLDRLTWRYGPERARAIFNGEDAEAAADLRAWRSLGEGVGR